MGRLYCWAAGKRHEYGRVVRLPDKHDDDDDVNAVNHHATVHHGNNNDVFSDQMEALTRTVAKTLDCPYPGRLLMEVGGGGGGGGSNNGGKSGRKTTKTISNSDLVLLVPNDITFLQDGDKVVYEPSMTTSSSQQQRQEQLIAIEEDSSREAEEDHIDSRATAATKKRENTESSVGAQKYEDNNKCDQESEPVDLETTNHGNDCRSSSLLWQSTDDESESESKDKTKGIDPRSCLRPADHCTPVRRTPSPRKPKTAARQTNGNSSCPFWSSTEDDNSDSEAARTPVRRQPSPTKRKPSTETKRRRTMTTRRKLRTTSSPPQPSTDDDDGSSSSSSSYSEREGEAKAKGSSASPSPPLVGRAATKQKPSSVPRKRKTTTARRKEGNVRRGRRVGAGAILVDGRRQYTASSRSAIMNFVVRHSGHEYVDRSISDVVAEKPNGAEANESSAIEILNSHVDQDLIVDQDHVTNSEEDSSGSNEEEEADNDAVPEEQKHDMKTNQTQRVQAPKVSEKFFVFCHDFEYPIEVLDVDHETEECKIAWMYPNRGTDWIDFDDLLPWSEYRFSTWNNAVQQMQAKHQEKRQAKLDQERQVKRRKRERKDVMKEKRQIDHVKQLYKRYGPPTRITNIELRFKRHAGTVLESHDRLVYYAIEDDTVQKIVSSKINQRVCLPVEKVLYDNRPLYPKLTKAKKLKACTPIVLPLTWKRKKVQIRRC